MLITPSSVKEAEAGVVNTVVQLGIAARDPRSSARCFTSLATHGLATAITASLWAGMAMFEVALLACFGLPRRQ